MMGEERNRTGGHHPQEAPRVPLLGLGSTTPAPQSLPPMGIPRMLHLHHSASGSNVALSPESAAAADLFDQFCNAQTIKTILGTFRLLCDLLRIKPTNWPVFYPRLKAKLRSWKAQALWAKFDKRASHKLYNRGKACANTRVLIIGAGPCGLRAAIDAQLLGAKVVVLEKRDRFSRNNVLHLWPFVIHDLRNLGAKKFFGKFCAGSIDHISIRQLQCILLKVALLLGVEIHENVTFEDLLEPPVDQTNERIGWRASVSPRDHPVCQYEFDVLIGADGKRNTLRGFKRKEFRGKLAIAITANFINRHSEAEAQVQEISGVAFIFNQKFFTELREQSGIDLENIVYYKDETHYFVMTAKKYSLIEKGVILHDYADTARLLAPDNVSREALLEYAREAADFSSNYQLPHLDFAVNHYGQADVAMFDFTSMYAAESACRVFEKRGHRLLQALVGDSLLEPFWPTGSGCARGFLSCMDACWMIRSWASGSLSVIQVLAERESIYRLLAQTTPENLNKDFNEWTLNPQSRYPNLNFQSVRPSQMRNLIDGEFCEEISENLAPVEAPRKKRRKDALVHPDALLKWCQRQLSDYRNLEVTNLTYSFKNGLALCAIVHRYRPDLVDFHTLNEVEIAKNNQLVFDLLDREFGILPMMSGKEMENCIAPDHLTMVAYLSQVYDTFHGEIPHIARHYVLPEPPPQFIEDRTMDHVPGSPSLPHRKSPIARSLNLINKISQRLSTGVTSVPGGRKQRYSIERREMATAAFNSVLSGKERMAESKRKSGKRRSLERDRALFILNKDNKRELYAPPADLLIERKNFSSRVKDLEDKLTGKTPPIVVERPVSPGIKVGRIERGDWNIRMLEEKMKEQKSPKKGHEPKVPLWTKDNFDDKVKSLQVHGNGVDDEVTKYGSFDSKLRLLEMKLKEGSNLETGQRGANKVSAMAEQLSAILDPKPQHIPLQRSNSKPCLINPSGGGSEVCHFCAKRVYLMERQSAQGKFFHRGCFKCECCSTTLRLSSYGVGTEAHGQYIGKFLCMHHFTMRLLARKRPADEEHKRVSPAPTPAKRSGQTPVGEKAKSIQKATSPRAMLTRESSLPISTEARLVDSKPSTSKVGPHRNPLRKSPSTPSKKVSPLLSPHQADKPLLGKERRRTVSHGAGEIEKMLESGRKSNGRPPRRGSIKGGIDRSSVEVDFYKEMAQTPGVTPERVEFENTLDLMSEEEQLSEIDEDEWTDRNFGTSCTELDSTDQSDFSSEEMSPEAEEELEEVLQRSFTSDGTRHLAETWKLRYEKSSNGDDLDTDEEYGESGEEFSYEEYENDVRSASTDREVLCRKQNVASTPSTEGEGAGEAQADIEGDGVKPPIARRSDYKEFHGGDEIESDDDTEVGSMSQSSDYSDTETDSSDSETESKSPSTSDFSDNETPLRKTKRHRSAPHLFRVPTIVIEDIPSNVSPPLFDDDDAYFDRLQKQSEEAEKTLEKLIGRKVNEVSDTATRRELYLESLVTGRNGDTTPTTETPDDANAVREEIQPLLVGTRKTSSGSGNFSRDVSTCSLQEELLKSHKPSKKSEKTPPPGDRDILACAVNQVIVNSYAATAEENIKQNSNVVQENKKNSLPGAKIALRKRSSSTSSTSSTSSSDSVNEPVRRRRGSRIAERRSSVQRENSLKNKENVTLRRLESARKVQDNGCAYPVAKSSSHASVFGRSRPELLRQDKTPILPAANNKKTNQVLMRNNRTNDPQMALAKSQSHACVPEQEAETPSSNRNSKRFSSNMEVNILKDSTDTLNKNFTGGGTLGRRKPVPSETKKAIIASTGDQTGEKRQSWMESAASLPDLAKANDSEKVMESATARMMLKLKERYLLGTSPTDAPSPVFPQESPVKNEDDLPQTVIPVSPPEVVTVGLATYTKVSTSPTLPSIVSAVPKLEPVVKSFLDVITEKQKMLAPAPAPSPSSSVSLMFGSDGKRQISPSTDKIFSRIHPNSPLFVSPPKLLPVCANSSDRNLFSPIEKIESDEMKELPKHSDSEKHKKDLENTMLQSQSKSLQAEAPVTKSIDDVQTESVPSNEEIVGDDAEIPEKCAKALDLESPPCVETEEKALERPEIQNTEETENREVNAPPETDTNAESPNQMGEDDVFEDVAMESLPCPSLPPAPPPVEDDLPNIVFPIDDRNVTVRRSKKTENFEACALQKDSSFEPVTDTDCSIYQTDTSSNELNSSLINSSAEVTALPETPLPVEETENVETEKVEESEDENCEEVKDEEEVTAEVSTGTPNTAPRYEGNFARFANKIGPFGGIRDSIYIHKSSKRSLAKSESADGKLMVNIDISNKSDEKDGSECHSPSGATVGQTVKTVKRNESKRRRNRSINDDLDEIPFADDEHNSEHSSKSGNNQRLPTSSAESSSLTSPSSTDLPPTPPAEEGTDTSTPTPHSSSPMISKPLDSTLVVLRHRDKFSTPLRRVPLNRPLSMIETSPPSFTPTKKVLPDTPLTNPELFAAISSKKNNSATPVNEAENLRLMKTAERERARHEARERARLKSDEELGLSSPDYIKLRKRYQKELERQKGDTSIVEDLSLSDFACRPVVSPDSEKVSSSSPTTEGPSTPHSYNSSSSNLSTKGFPDENACKFSKLLSSCSEDAISRTIPSVSLPISPCSSLESQSLTSPDVVPIDKNEMTSSLSSVAASTSKTTTSDGNHYLETELSDPDLLLSPGSPPYKPQFSMNPLKKSSTLPSSTLIPKAVSNIPKPIKSIMSNKEPKQVSSPPKLTPSPLSPQATSPTSPGAKSPKDKKVGILSKFSSFVRSASSSDLRNRALKEKKEKESSGNSSSGSGKTSPSSLLSSALSDIKVDGTPKESRFPKLRLNRSKERAKEKRKLKSLNKDSSLDQSSDASVANTSASSVGSPDTDHGRESVLRKPTQLDVTMSFPSHPSATSPDVVQDAKLRSPTSVFLNRSELIASMAQISQKVLPHSTSSSSKNSDDQSNGNGTQNNSVTVAPKALGEDSLSDTEDDVTEDRSQASQLSLTKKPKETIEEQIRRRQKVAERVYRRQEQQRLRRAQEIQSQLEELDVQLKEMELRGVSVERALRGEGQGTTSGKDESELLQEWFTLIREKQAFVQREQELMVKAKELELEDRHARLQQELYRRMAVEDKTKSEDQIVEEGRILAEMLEIVEQRDALVAMTEEDRQRDLEDEDPITSPVNTKRLPPAIAVANR